MVVTSNLFGYYYYFFFLVDRGFLAKNFQRGIFRSMVIVSWRDLFNLEKKKASDVHKGLPFD